MATRRRRLATLLEALLLGEGEEGVAPPAEMVEALEELREAVEALSAVGGADRLLEASRALPWLAAYLDWAERGKSAQEVAEALRDWGALSALEATMVAEQLDRLSAQRREEAVRRRPRRMAAEKDEAVALFSRLAEAQRGLAELVHIEDDAALRDALFARTALLPVAVDLLQRPGHRSTTLGRRLEGLVGGWADAGDGPDQPSPHVKRSRPLTLLARLAQGHGGMPAPLDRLDDQARRFEQTLVTDLGDRGVLDAVKAAMLHGPLAVGARSAPRQPALGWQLSVFHRDPALEALAEALIEARWRALAVVRGQAGLEALGSWVRYLRGPCLELAESREMTLREATHYAHYALHVLNLCDLASLGLRATHDGTRRALMSLEEELKEFALAGQRRGLRDDQVALERFEMARWRSSGPAAYLAERLARLRGSWRAGLRSGPIGAPARVEDAEILAHSLALVESLPEASDSEALDALATAARRCLILEADWLEQLAAHEVLKLLILGLRLAAARPDDESLLIFDPGPLVRWYADERSGALHRKMFSELLQRSPAHLEAAPQRARCGLRAELLADPTAAARRLTLHFLADEELDALLVLLGSTPDASLRQILESRLASLLNCGLPTTAKGDGQTPAPLESTSRIEDSRL